MEPKARSLGGLVMLALLVSGCSSPPPEVEPGVALTGPSIPAGFIPIDFSDTGYADVERFAKDSVTPDGWAIQYLVKDDSTRYTDLYVRWSKGGHDGLFQCGDVLLMRRFFIPVFTGENASHIFLEHGCSTSDEAMLVLSKDSLVGREVWVMFDFDLDLGQIAYVPERSFSLDTLEVSVVDFTRGQERSVIFKNHCNLAPEYGCIDSVSFTPKRTELFATLIDDAGGTVRETQIVGFDEPSNSRSQ